MSLLDLASIGSFVSGLAVLISLVYLNLQIRQSARNQRSLFLQGQAQRSMDFSIRMADPAYAPVWDKTLDCEGELTLTEYRQVRNLVIALARMTEEAYFQYREGLISQAVFEGIAGSLRPMFYFPRPRVFWRTTKIMFDPGFARIVDKMVEETPLSDGSTTLADFHRQVAEELTTVRLAPAGDPAFERLA
jgi:hypothetical protein